MGVSEEAGSARRVRRWRTVSEKRRIAELTFEPGASVALGARAHGVNANQLFKRRRAFKPLMTHPALLEFFRAVADASPIPILIYSIPQFTGVEVPGELVARLAEHPNICGIKDSWGKLPVVK